MHLKQAIYESTLSTADAVPLPQWGRLRYENTAIPDPLSLPREGKAKRIGAERPITICGEAAATTLNPEP